jgi:hypothetical protein
VLRFTDARIVVAVDTHQLAGGDATGGDHPDGAGAPVGWPGTPPGQLDARIGRLMALLEAVGARRRAHLLPFDRAAFLAGLTSGGPIGRTGRPIDPDDVRAAAARSDGIPDLVVRLLDVASSDRASSSLTLAPYRDLIPWALDDVPF